MRAFSVPGFRVSGFRVVQFWVQCWFKEIFAVVRATL